MAANYWVSTQHSKWLLSKKRLAEIRTALELEDESLITQYPLPDRRLLSFYFQQLLIKLGRRAQVRQQALATAQVYIKRLYLRVEIRQTNPYLVLATALYLACKMEECPQYIRSVVSDARNLWPEFVTSDVSKLGECEFLLIAEMDCQLIIHHPYRTLTELQLPLNLSVDETTLAWTIINDHYLTDLPLLYPGYVIALTAIFLSLVLKPTPSGFQAAVTTLTNLANSVQNPNAAPAGDPPPPNSQQAKVQHLAKWLVDSQIDMKDLVDCTQEIISLYEVLEQYSDKTCKEQISRFVKGRNLDK